MVLAFLSGFAVVNHSSSRGMEMEVEAVIQRGEGISTLGAGHKTPTSGTPHIALVSLANFSLFLVYKM